MQDDDGLIGLIGLLIADSDSNSIYWGVDDDESLSKNSVESDSSSILVVGVIENSESLESDRL